MLCSRVARASRQTIRRNPHHHSEKEPRVVKHVPESESYHSESITKYYSVVPIPLLPHLTPLSQSNSSGFVTNQWSFPFVTFTCMFYSTCLSVCLSVCMSYQKQIAAQTSLSKASYHEHSSSSKACQLSSSVLWLYLYICLQ